MAASVKIEFDDGSRVISQTLEDAAGLVDAGASAVLSADKRSGAWSIEDFYEIAKTTNFIAEGKFKRVALQFPDPLLREAPEVVWTLQARLRKLQGPEGGGEKEPLIFVTGDTSYGSCCVDEVSAQHLKADAIVHYGRACLSPTNASVPVLYVFGRGDLDVQDLASTLLSGPLASTPPPEKDGTTTTSTTTTVTKAPVLLLYDVTYAYAIPALLENLGDDVTRSGSLVVGFPTPEAYDPLLQGDPRVVRQNACCQAGAGYDKPKSGAIEGGDTGLCRSSGVGEGRKVCSSRKGVERKGCGDTDGAGGGGFNGGGIEGGDTEVSTASPNGGVVDVLPPEVSEEGNDAVAAESLGNSTTAAATAAAAAAAASLRRVRIGGLGVEVGSEEALKRHSLVFVGREGRQLSNVLLRCAGCVDRVRYDPTLPAGQRLVMDTGKGNKDLMRRYYLVQRAREASVFGVVVGTLGVQRYGSVVRAVRKTIEDAGRKAYTLAVGKVNVAKLANFAEVEVFCLVACAENSLLDSKEFHAPVVTPLELEIALGRRAWDGFYSTDFDDILGLTPRHGSPDPNGASSPALSGSGVESLSLKESQENGAQNGVNLDEEAGSDNDRPFFSLVSGTYKSNPGVLRGNEAALGGGREGGGALVGVADGSIVEWSSPAANFLGQREYQGLEALVGQTEAKPATEGQSGIASDYGGF